MRAKILITLLLAAVCAASKEDWDAFITPIDKNDPNGKMIFHLLQLRDEKLDVVLNNPDPRTIDTIILNSTSIEDIRKIFEVYGKQATTLAIIADENLIYNAQDIFDVLNLLPNLEFLVLKAKIEGDADGILSLKNLIQLEAFEASFFTKVLPENSLKRLKIHNENENYAQLLSKQLSLKTLILDASAPVFNEVFNHLKLEKFILHASQIDDEAFKKSRSSRQKFIKEVLATQPDLKFLDFDDYRVIINDEIFEEIVKLEKLEKLDLFVKGERITKFELLENLKNLKELSIPYQGLGNKTINFINKFSTIKLETLEKLEIHYVLPEAPTESYERISQNIPNLKALTLDRTQVHTVNFIAKTFPQIEEIKLIYGIPDPVIPFTFQEAFEKNSGIVHENMKRIDFTFVSEEKVPIDVDDFVEFLKMFPKLENLTIAADFPFTTDFFSKLTDNLNNIKVLKIESILVEYREKFPIEKSNALKELASKLEKFEISFAPNQGTGVTSFITNLFGSFTFEPLIEQVSDVFKFAKVDGELKLTKKEK